MLRGRGFRQHELQVRVRPGGSEAAALTAPAGRPVRVGRDAHEALGKGLSQFKEPDPGRAVNEDGVREARAHGEKFAEGFAEPGVRRLLRRRLQSCFRQSHFAVSSNMRASIASGVSAALSTTKRSG